MAFNCKPSGGYGINSTEGINNETEYYYYFSSIATRNCIIGMLCNIVEESGLNPWRWQGDSVNTSNGYGLYQYTPASGYINLTGITGHAPNMSTSAISGGDPSDAYAQMYVFEHNTLSKWVNTCWRSYWSATDYPLLYARRTHILNTYGDGSTLSMEQFFQIDDAEDACFAFLACFEGPNVPNFSDRTSHIQDLDNNLPNADDDLIAILYKYSRRYLK